jgi:hypothetical protein
LVNVAVGLDVETHAPSLGTAKTKAAPVPEFTPGELMRARVPSAERETERPNWSPATGLGFVSVAVAVEVEDQELSLVVWNTAAYPLYPLYVPTTTVVPSAEIDTDCPKPSWFVLAASVKAAVGVEDETHAVSLGTWKTKASPLPELVARIDPMIAVLPSADTASE